MSKLPSVLFCLVLSGCAATPAPPSGQTAPWTAERSDGEEATVTMVCRSGFRGPPCDPGDYSIVVDAMSACRIMGHENAVPHPLTSTRTTLFEHTVRYSITFECVGSEGR